MILSLVIGGAVAAALSTKPVRAFAARQVNGGQSPKRQETAVAVTARPQRRVRRGRRPTKPKSVLTEIKAMLTSTGTQALRAEIDPSAKKAQEQKRLADRRERLLSFAALGLTGLATVFPVLIPLGVASILYLSRETFRLIRRDFQRGHYLSFYLVSAILTFGMVIGGHLILAVLNTIMFAYFAGLANRMEEQAEAHLVDVFYQHPEHVWLLVDDVEVQTPFSQLKPGDTVIVRAGEIIPVDGRVLSGVAQVDQHILTGESQPVEKEPGDEVLASTLLLSGQLTLAVTLAGDLTVAAKIGQVLNRTKSYKDTIMLRGREIGDRFIPVKLALATVTLPFMGLNAALAIMWANLGQGLSITSPLTLMIYLQILSRHLILVKDGRVFETLLNVDTVVFDKTGTLTEEQPTLGTIHTANGFKESDVLRLAAAAEHRVPHPIARAIIAKAREMGLDYPVFDETSYEIGYGIKVKIEGREVKVGSARFMQRETIAFPEVLSAVREQAEASGHSLVYVSVDEQLAGLLEMQPTIRPEARKLIRNLQGRGLTVYIISGDHEAPTYAMAQELGVDHYFAEILPENKADLVAKFRDEGRCVCFVGDGVNDAIALKAAHVSISLKGASTAATDTAQIIFMDGTLQRLEQLFDLVDEFKITMRRVVAIGFTPGILTIAGVFFLHFGVLISLIILYLNMCLGISNVVWPIVRHRNILVEQRPNKEGEST